jgi:putative membrane protein
MTAKADIREPRAFAPDDPALKSDAQEAMPPGAIPQSRKSRPAAPPTSVRPTVAHLSRGIRWGAMLMSGIAGLAALATVLWFTAYVQVALQRQDWVGWLAFALLCVVGFSALVLILREIFGLLRLARLGKLRNDVKEALAERNLARERRAVRHLKAVLSGRADLAWPLARFAEHEQAVLNPGDLVGMCVV